jgi:hypothetical protein
MDQQTGREARVSHLRKTCTTFYKRQNIVMTAYKDEMQVCTKHATTQNQVNRHRQYGLRTNKLYARTK